jgi:hypothetical protein
MKRVRGDFMANTELKPINRLDELKISSKIVDGLCAERYPGCTKYCPGIDVPNCTVYESLREARH